MPLIQSQDRLTSGILSVDERAEPSAPLLVCIHGGGCNGGYFDIKGYSTAQIARERGFALLLVHRPGHGGNRPVEGEQPIADAMPVIRRFIDEVRERHFTSGSPLFLLGHSIGGAIALTLAAESGDWPLRAVAVSGIGDEPTPAIRSWWSASPPGLFPPGEPGASLFLGPDGSYHWQAPIALRRSSEPWQPAEVAEIVRRWPERWPGVAACIDVPVHLRLAEHDKIWTATDERVRRMADRLVRSPKVDAALLPDGGHLYEIHRRGPELVEAQLAFMQRFR